MNTELVVTEDGHTYQWHGHFGNVFTSFERGVRVATIRHILGCFFKAYKVQPRGWFRPSEIWWVPVENVSAEWIREFKQKLVK